MEEKVFVVKAEVVVTAANEEEAYEQGIEDLKLRSTEGSLIVDITEVEEYADFIGG